MYQKLKTVTSPISPHEDCYKDDKDNRDNKADKGFNDAHETVAPGTGLCPSRLPEHTSSAWRRRIMRGKGVKARMLQNRPAVSFAVSVDERYGNTCNGKVYEDLYLL